MQSKEATEWDVKELKRQVDDLNEEVQKMKEFLIFSDIKVREFTTDPDGDGKYLIYDYNRGREMPYRDYRIKRKLINKWHKKYKNYDLIKKADNYVREKEDFSNETFDDVWRR